MKKIELEQRLKELEDNLKIQIDNNKILNIAPIKNESNIVTIVLPKPKINPKPHINFTSPKPIPPLLAQ